MSGSFFLERRSLAGGPKRIVSKKPQPRKIRMLLLTREVTAFTIALLGIRFPIFYSTGMTVLNAMHFISANRPQACDVLPCALGNERGTGARAYSRDWSMQSAISKQLPFGSNFEIPFRPGGGGE